MHLEHLEDEMFNGGYAKFTAALSSLGGVLRLAQGRQQHPSENRDDGDDDQQFNERERGGA